MQLSCNTRFDIPCQSPPVEYACRALRRDFGAVFRASRQPGGRVRACPDGTLPPEAYRLCVQGDTLTLYAGDDLGFVYGLFEISRRFLGVQPFWFWNDQRFAPTDCCLVPDGLCLQSAPARVRYRGWFVNDETLISTWSVDRRPEAPWEMVFETLLRCGGNLVIPGTDANARRYRALAARMGLILTHHHAEPLGAEMFARAYPDLDPSFDKYPDRFRALWRQAVRDQAGCRVVWNLGFRGQGDRPFWSDDPRYDTPAARGALLSAIIREQYDLVRQSDPGAVCSTNLYGEMMELYRDGFLQLPPDVIRIWADNGYGRMVSRRQGNQNPRVPALPAAGDTGAHGLYYHASFYDLQAASHITMLPNSPRFVCAELQTALERGVDDLWIVNCSNVKPHVYMLDLIAGLWRGGRMDPDAHSLSYAGAYYGAPCAGDVAQNLLDYADHAVAYGPNPDDHAGDQFYNHVPRMLMTRFIADRNAPAAELRWLCDLPDLEKQAARCADLFENAADNYGRYLRDCERTMADLSGAARTLFADTVLLQARLYRLWARGALEVCRALAYGFAGDWQRCFYHAGRARRDYAAADRALREREHGKWVDFYANECQTDVKQTAAVCGYLMSFARTLGEGPHFYRWQREFQDSEAERRVMLILNVRNHPTDEELWRLMEQRWGE